MLTHISTKYIESERFTMKNELVKFKEMELINVDFNDDEITVVKMKDTSKLYVGVKFVCQAIGFNETQSKAQVEKIRDDELLSQGVGELRLPTKGGNQKSLCIELDYLPLWLAKIVITNKMKQSSPEAVEKLKIYQLKAKDILAQAFIGKKESWDSQRIIAKHDRNKMTDKIKEELNPKWYVYSNYTDMIYTILFGKRAKEIREEKGLTKSSQYTRDYLTEEQLKLVDDAETIVTGLVALGFKFDYIKYQLEQKYTKRLSDGDING